MIVALVHYLHYNIVHWIVQYIIKYTTLNKVEYKCTLVHFYKMTPFTTQYMVQYLV